MSDSSQGRSATEGVSPGVVVRQATSDDLPLLISLLEGATAWLRSRGVAQWIIPFPVDVVRADIDDGRAWVAWREDEPAGTVALSVSDQLLWGDRTDHAWYVHRLVTDRRIPGTGRQILDWVEQEAAGQGVGRIRLDCGPGLRSYYERAATCGAPT